MKKNVPVGATWKVQNEDGTNATIWLDEKKDGVFEIWRWYACYPDGSSPDGWHGWSSSYNGAKNSLPIDGRMKRVK